MKQFKTDFLIIGSGAAGLTLALKLHSLGKVTLTTKSKLKKSNSAWAQGGIASVSGTDDDWELHLNDTLRAGGDLTHTQIAKQFIGQAPDRIRELQEWGVKFDLDPTTGAPDLHREGGHSARRILHSTDQTGQEIVRALSDRVLALTAPEKSDFDLIEKAYAIELILNHTCNPMLAESSRVVGAYFLQIETREVFAIMAQNVFLCTGGAGRIYQYTSNWEGATGDGIALAYRAGARVADLEFMQFHPTCLYHSKAKNFLISEALRGEGGELINQEGRAFMKEAHPLGSLAPRDIVARTIDLELKRSGASHVFLDLTHHPRSFLEKKFPKIFSSCLELGIDISKVPIPVVPAAHYLCGGVWADEHGQTDLPGLWAIGETACTGFHGANRLASNSLLECLAMAHNAAEKIRDQAYSSETEKLMRPLLRGALIAPDWVSPAAEDLDELSVIHHIWDEIRRLCWNYVGICRTDRRLARARARLNLIMTEIEEYYSDLKPHENILELRNLALVAKLTVECALRRKESRGCHFNQDHPNSQTPPKHTLIRR